jgi:hypothetical protein
MKRFSTLALLVLAISTVFASNPVNPNTLRVIFEWTVGSHRTRDGLHIFRVLDGPTGKEVKNTLTQEEQDYGATLISRRRAPSFVDEGKTQYGILWFDTINHQYFTH